MRIFHIATLADWQAAQTAGSYAVSTRGRTLAEEGFIHASRGDQWQGVRERFYADVTEPLVLLVIDTDLLTSPVVDEAVPDSEDTFPHVYGPIGVSAVVTTVPLDDSPSPPARPTSVAATAATPSPAESSSTRAAVVSGGLPTSSAPDAAADGPHPTFSQLFLREIFKQLVLASLVLAVVVALTLVGLSTGLEWGPISGAAVGLALGVLAARQVTRRRTD